MDTLQVVAEPRRRQILHMVWDRERTAGDIAQGFDVSFAAVSQHLAVLREAGLVKVRAQGRHRYYKAAKNDMGPLRRTLESMWGASLDRLADLVEESRVNDEGPVVVERSVRALPRITHRGSLPIPATFI
jgi:DNA-binding transcriptional ArsR family regulator